MNTTNWHNDPHHASHKMEAVTKSQNGDSHKIGAVTKWRHTNLLSSQFVVQTILYF